MTIAHWTTIFHFIILQHDFASYNLLGTNIFFGYWRKLWKVSGLIQFRKCKIMPRKFDADDFGPEISLITSIQFIYSCRFQPTENLQISESIKWLYRQTASHSPASHLSTGNTALPQWYTYYYKNPEWIWRVEPVRVRAHNYDVVVNE